MALYNSTSSTISGSHSHFLAKSPVETRYSAFDCELLAVFATIRHFRHNLEGRNFFVNTDHKPLTYLMTSVTERPSMRQTRHLTFIAEFTTDIRHVKGETNFDADALSRPSVSAISNASAINYKELSEDQALDTAFTRLSHSTSSTLNFQFLKSFYNNLILCDVSTGHTRPYITAKFIVKVARPRKYLVIISQFSASSLNQARDLTTYISI